MDGETVHCFGQDDVLWVILVGMNKRFGRRMEMGDGQAFCEEILGLVDYGGRLGMS
jgi:hypothetical protein